MFVRELVSIVGRKHLLTREAETEAFRRGYRYGGGPCEAVVRPGRLFELWRVLQACMSHGRIIVLQAANTGLTGGSTPCGDDYDRPVVIVSTIRIRGIQPIEDGRQAICLAGATLHELEQVLRPFGREPHSVIGSSCIGASVVGGICNNSGGALVRRGRAYTEFALFARVSPDGALELVNHLGVQLGETPEEILTRLDLGRYGPEDIAPRPELCASDRAYAEEVRKVDLDSPARFNADPRRLHEASGSAGRLAVFAVRLDTFPSEVEPAVFYVGSNDPEELSRLRRRALQDLAPLPIAAEYVHRDAFDLGVRYGKDLYLAIGWFGADRLASLFKWKRRADKFGRLLRIRGLGDRLAQALSQLAPAHLPPRLMGFRDRYAHHLMLKVSRSDSADFRMLLQSMFPSLTGDWFECTPHEGEAAFRHRFVIAGAGVRYREVHFNEVEDILALDIALRRNDPDWFERLPPEAEAACVHKIYYGHFFCHVLHQDYIIKAGHSVPELKAKMLGRLDARGAKYPAEHNVGHLYRAEPQLLDFYRRLDPTNSLNPGIGGSSKRRNWR